MACKGCAGQAAAVRPGTGDSPTRAPTRPNPIGLSVVRLVSVQENTLHIENVDVLNGTPLLDLKPYVPRFDVHPADRTGWLQRVQDRARDRRSDERFSGESSPAHHEGLDGGDRHEAH